MPCSEEESPMVEGEEREAGDRREALQPSAVESEAGDATVLLSELEEADLRRVVLLQGLLATEDRLGYGDRQEAVAEELGITVRSVRRLMRQMREQGVASVVRRSRSDRGLSRIDERWQEFILQTYRDGNRGSRQMSPAQVAVRVRSRAEEMGVEDYPSHMTVYRILQPTIEQKQQTKRSLGWRRDCLVLRTRDGLEIPIEWSNQVWQVDHTRVDVLLVDQAGSLLGRPWLTLVVDTYSRCIMGIHLGFDAPSAAVVCLALRHAILPKQYSSAYELQESWGTYGLPQHLYTDGGKDFRSQHIEQVAIELGIVLHLRRKPSEGGIVERPFGTFNTQFFSGLPGYVSSNVVERSPKAESEACLTLLQLEQLLVRYIVDHYNRTIDARMGERASLRLRQQSRIGGWEAGRISQLRLLGDRELDNCLMRRDRRVVYRSGYLQFANLTYQGEHLGAYAGESMIIRYDPRDITTIYIYHLQDSKEAFLSRAHAQGWETEVLSYKEAQAISQRRREAGQAIDPRALLSEVRDRDQAVKKSQQRKKKQNLDSIETRIAETTPETPLDPQLSEYQKLGSTPVKAPECETPTELQPPSEPPKRTVPYVRVLDYEQMKRDGGLL